MNQIIFLTSLICIAKTQIIPVDSDTQRAINSIFNNTVYEVITQEPLRSFGALQVCGENERQGLDKCVPYYNCDPTTKMIIQDGVTDGFGVLDVRYDGEESECSHYLEVCCQIPPNVTSSSPASIERTEGTSSTTARPFTSPTIRTPRPDTQEDDTSDRDSIPRVEQNDSWSSCGKRNPNGIDFKLLGNTENEAEYGEFPWQMALLRTKYDKRVHRHQCLCGGSLIRPNVVLTATHCILGLKANDITVRAGEWDTQTTKERIPHQERVVSRIISHEQYGDGAINDIALLVLEKPFIKTKSVGTVCLPEQGQIISSKQCFASGWGKSNFGKEGAYAVLLKKIQLPMVTHSECQRLLRRTRLGPQFDLHNSFICAGGEAGKDTCTGDGGSPLVCPYPNQSERYIQTGIVSWGIGCGKQNIPGVYTNVAGFRTWIDNKLRELKIL